MIRPQSVVPMPVLLSLAVTLAGCGPAAQATSIPMATVPYSEAPPAETVASEPGATEATAAPDGSVPSQWVELRDEGYGYGLAIPCWWPVIPGGTQGIIRTTTLASYDEAFFLAHSERGVWIGGEYPPGVVKIDVTGFGGIDPALSTEDAVRQALTNDIQAVASVEEQTSGRYTAVVATLQNLVNSSAPASRAVIFRLAPDTLLLFSVYPDAALESSDVQGILQSLALTPQEAVVFPDVAPSEPIIALPDVCSTVTP